MIMFYSIQYSCEFVSVQFFGYCTVKQATLISSEKSADTANVAYVHKIALNVRTIRIQPEKNLQMQLIKRGNIYSYYII